MATNKELVEHYKNEGWKQIGFTQEQYGTALFYKEYPKEKTYYLTLVTKDGEQHRLYSKGLVDYQISGKLSDLPKEQEVLKLC